MFEFPCHRWLAKDEDDGQITRELVCAEGSQSANMYLAPGQNLSLLCIQLLAKVIFYVMK